MIGPKMKEGHTVEKIRIPIEQGYDVLIGHGLLDRAGDLIKNQVQDRKVLLVTDEHVAEQGYASRVTHAIKSVAEVIHVKVIPPGEKQKSLSNVEELVEMLASLNFSRQDCLIALGGGVIGDLVGFVASIYLRGIDFIQIPTTLLAAIDSSVGGKTAVDLPQGKNLVGAFHHPSVVLCDVATFETLPAAIFEEGCSELIKYGMIMKPSLLQELMSREQPLTAQDPELVRLVKTCVEMKSSVVVEDEFDQGLRQLLNYGHTLGHALEQVSQYEISHGRAIATGMQLFLQMAMQRRELPPDYLTNFTQLLDDYHLLEGPYVYSAKDLNQAMLNDKKRRRHTMTIVLPSEFGRCELIELPVVEFSQWFEKEWNADVSTKN